MWRRFTDIFVEYVNPSHVSCDELAVSVAVAGISYQLSGDLCSFVSACTPCLTSSQIVMK